MKSNNELRTIFKEVVKSNTDRISVGINHAVESYCALSIMPETEEETRRKAVRMFIHLLSKELMEFTKNQI